MAFHAIMECFNTVINVIWREFVSLWTNRTSSEISTNEVLFVSEPLWKSRTQIVWSRNNMKQSIVGLNLTSYLNMPATNTKSVIVSFFTSNGEPVRNVLSNTDSNLEAEVWLESGKPRSKIEATVVEADCSTSNENINTPNNKIQIIFSGKEAGKYTVILRSSGLIVRGFPFVGYVVPGKADHRASSLIENRSSTLLITADYGHLTDFSCPETICVDPRDSFGNHIKDPVELESLCDKIQLVLWKCVDTYPEREDMVVLDKNFVVYRGSGQNGECLHISLSFSPGQEGWYTAQILLDQRKINMTKDLTLIVINPEGRLKVNNILNNNQVTNGSSYFEGELVGLDGNLFEKSKKYKKVYVYLTGRQLTIREYFLKFIPIRLYTFRCSPSTKVKLVYDPVENLCIEPKKMIDKEYKKIKCTIIEIDDGYQSRPQLIFKDNKFGKNQNGGTLFATLYHKLLLQKIGGSETFQDKQSLFNKKLVEYHQEKGNKRNKLCLSIDRSCIVNSSYQSTRYLHDPHWIHLFEIKFEGEQGIDQGGLRREWFEVLCRELFRPSFNLFVQAEQGSDALHPNPYLDDFEKDRLNSYRFAGKIVGKCLIESAYGSSYRQLLPVRFAKSFLAQVVGLRVQYKHFCNDTPDFYSTKVHSIITGNVDEKDGGMNDMTFEEEEYERSQSRSSIRTVELKPNGSRIKVTERNKYEYLDALAQYKLCNRIKRQTSAFLDGLHRLVPDSLLSLFDENELELLLCGIREYSLSELKKHHTVIGGSAKMLNWFWIILESFTAEQMARLVQFTTGSSQLPTGGFADLQPMLQIMSSGERNSLPTAHTCFNMICLPVHDEFTNFEQSLLTAITEGNEGFGLA